MNLKNIEIISRFNQVYLQFQKVAGKPHGLLPEIEWRVLEEIRKRPSTAKDIVNVTRLDKGYLSRLLTRLSKQGYLIRKINPADKRATLLSITNKGRKYQAQIYHHHLSKMAESTQDLTPSATRQLISHLSALTALLEKEMLSR